jgi:hypothetical protein
VIDNFPNDYKVNLTDIGFKIAFGVNDYSTGVPLDDPNFVKFSVNMVELDNQVKVATIPLKLKKCTD